ncbi:hypothetical protein B005_1830 [Nocardiopsis alba ATCC BAA-2165]|uniref:Uncharacterized protein n=1 Tax=Nocardiopsis alba (strain ATCC BAA-2165 / BE74) TaxID=1205910 RepID=J7LH95_NOCAA|nr:hypothetical protein B005_1830 [Nocardiopsis alba ATCC BAA-2165]
MCLHRGAGRTEPLIVNRRPLADRSSRVRPLPPLDATPAVHEV